MVNSGEHLAQTFGNLSLWGQLQHLVTSDERPLRGESDDRINILLLGISGKDHDGPQLSDTIMVASIKPSTHQLALISLPRDLVAPIPGYGWRKINHANAYGELRGTGAGPDLASQTVTAVLNIPIDYYVRIDFDGFTKLIDDLGGITVTVDRLLDDVSYPIKGKENAPLAERYEHLYIEPGEHTMNGTLALKYVRSRQAKGVEGSDFARSQRQQKVLVAVREELLSFGTLANPYAINRLTNTISENLVTNLQAWEMLRLLDMAKTIDQQKIINYGFDDSPTGQLVAGMSSDGEFVLQPKAGNFFDMQKIARDIFDPSAPSRRPSVRIAIRNGTKINGLATQTAEQLRRQGYNILDTANATTQDYQRSVIYITHKSTVPSTTAATIARIVNAPIATILPPWLEATSTSGISPAADIVVILGQDQKQ